MIAAQRAVTTCVLTDVSDLRIRRALVRSWMALQPYAPGHGGCDGQPGANHRRSYSHQPAHYGYERHETAHDCDPLQSDVRLNLRDDVESPLIAIPR